MCCHDSDRSGWSLLVREVKMSINVPRLAATVSMIDEWCRLLRMATSRWVHMMCVWARGTVWTVVHTSMFSWHFRVLGCRVWCVYHNISHCWGDVLIHHSWNVNFMATAAGLRTVMLILMRDFVSVWPACTIGRVTQFVTSLSSKIHI